MPSRCESRVNAGQKELDPCFPVSGGAHAREEIVINLAIGFEIQTQVEDGLRQRATCAEQESDEEASETSVAVEKRVDGLELQMGERCPNKKRQIFSLRMEKQLELAHAIHDEFGRVAEQRRRCQAVCRQSSSGSGETRRVLCCFPGRAKAGFRGSRE